MKILTKLETNTHFWYLLTVCILFFLFRLPSLFEPNWYGDEGIYQVIGMALNNGRLLYLDIWDNKPPLLYIVYGILFGDQFSVRLASLIIGLFAIIAFFFLAKKLFTIPTITTGIFALLFGLPIIEGNIANAENFMLLPILIGAICVYKASEETKQSNKLLFAAGALFAAAFLFKIVAIFDFAAFAVFLLLVKTKHFLELGKTMQKLIPFFIGFVSPILAVLLYFIFLGAGWDFIQSVFLQMFGYVGYGNRLFFPHDLLLLKLLMLVGLVAYLFVNRNKFHKGVLFILVWFSFSLFNAFFAQRPYTHYLLVLLPSFSLLFGAIFLEKRNRLFLLIILLGAIFFVTNIFRFSFKTLHYYGNFVSFLMHKKSVTDYYAFFDSHTPKDYAVAQFLNRHARENDGVFLWGNNAQLYKLVNKLPPGRFIVAYHMKATEKTLQESENSFRRKQPRFVIVTSPRDPIPFSLMEYQPLFRIDSAVIYERYL